MIYVANDSENPFFNHAIEEYILKNKNEDAFILWRNRSAILIGRNQNTATEIDQEYVNTHNIDVVRRLSGGGTVFNDLGNINFTFITKKENNGKFLNTGFEKFALPVIKALHSLGINAVFTGRNDITIDGKKISGNAQYYYKNKILHHGTLLYSGNLEKLAKALKSKPLKFQDKGIKSVRSRVTNIADHLENPMDVLEFKEYLKKYIMSYYKISKEYTLSKQEYEETLEIQRKRFESIDWNYGKNSKSNFFSEGKFNAGTIEVLLEIHNQVIKSIKIHGDFFGKNPIEDLEKILVDKKLDKENLLYGLKDIEIDNYIKGISKEEFVGVLIKEK